MIQNSRPGLNNIAVEIDKTAATEESLNAITVDEKVWSKGHGNVYVLQVVSHLLCREAIIRLTSNNVCNVYTDQHTRYKIQDTRYKTLFKLGMVI